MDINIIFDYPFKGYGNHSAFVNHCNSLKNIGVKYKVNSLSPVELIHSHTIGPLSLISSRLFRGPYVFSCHLSNTEASYLKFSELIKKLYGILLKRADVIITPSPFGKRLLADIGKPVAAISNGVDLKRFKKDKKKRASFRERFEIEKNQLVVYCTAMMTEKKGIIDFCKTAEKFGDIAFVWSGRPFPHLRTNIKDLSKRYPQVRFAGFVKDIAEVHSGGDILLFPSYHELQGMPVLEATAAGNPVIVRDIEVFDWLRDEKHCLKFNGYASISDRLTQLIESPKLGKRLSRNAMSIVKNHDIKKVGKKYQKIYELCNSANFEEAGEVGSY